MVPVTDWHRMADELDKWTLVVAMSRNGVIGRDNALPWKLSSDLKRFKSMTMGQCLLMGRKTFESIGGPLPGRQTIVLSRAGLESALPPVTVVSDLSQVAECVEPGRRVMVVGGAQIYAAALPACDTLWITRVLVDVEGDTYFPPVEWSQWQLASSEAVAADAQNQWPSEFQIWLRKPID